MGQYHCSTWTLLALCLTLAFNVLHVQGQWENDYDGEVRKTCPNGQFLQLMISVHHNTHEDRRFTLGCRELPWCIGGSGNCWWGAWANDFDELVDYECAGDDAYIAGLESVHNNGKEDRRFKFYCCQLPNNYKLESCHLTNWVNEYDQVAAYVVPEGQVMKGMNSVHANKHEDRQFKYNVCNVVGY